MNYPVPPVTLLVVEDDPVLGKTIANGLAQEGYCCRIASSANRAVELASTEDFNIVILDVSVQNNSGLSVLRRIREANEDANVILLTSLESREERRAGLEEGADDFLIKPFALNEMHARVEAALIRLRTRPRASIEVGPISMNLTSRKVSHNGKQVQLTPTEFRILEILMRNEGRVVTRKMLCEFLWDPDWEGVTNVIEVHINRLRTKLKDGAERQLIHTVRGRGYSLRWREAGEQNGHRSPLAPRRSVVETRR